MGLLLWQQLVGSLGLSVLSVFSYVLLILIVVLFLCANFSALRNKYDYSISTLTNAYYLIITETCLECTTIFIEQTTEVVT